jgi:hypothetical protein
MKFEVENYTYIIILFQANYQQKLMYLECPCNYSSCLTFVFLDFFFSLDDSLT